MTRPQSPAAPVPRNVSELEAMVAEDMRQALLAEVDASHEHGGYAHLWCGTPECPGPQGILHAPAAASPRGGGNPVQPSERASSVRSLTAGPRTWWRHLERDQRLTAAVFVFNTCWAIALLVCIAIAASK